MKKVLITGITGFAGSHLAQLLVSKENYTVFGTYNSNSASSLQNISEIRDKVSLTKIDLLEMNEVENLLDQVEPDILFHLAALTSVAKSFENPTETLITNIQLQMNLLETIRKKNMTQIKIILVSSSNVYGLVSKKDLPINEKVSFNPDNPYAVSKITQDFLGLQYYLSNKLKIIRLRPFNHIGPRLSSEISISYFAKTIAEIEKGRHEPKITVGNLKARRDFTDVRDMVKAYELSYLNCRLGQAYNIGTGVSYEIEDLLHRLLSLSKIKITVVADPLRFRPSDIPELLCDSTKFRKETGWKPQISIDQSLHDILDYWRNLN